jgi:hypothetical protein
MKAGFAAIAHSRLWHEPDQSHCDGMSAADPEADETKLTTTAHPS